MLLEYSLDLSLCNSESFDFFKFSLRILFFCLALVFCSSCYKHKQISSQLKYYPQDNSRVCISTELIIVSDPTSPLVVQTYVLALAINHTQIRTWILYSIDRISHFSRRRGKNKVSTLLCSLICEVLQILFQVYSVLYQLELCLER